jgi:hypothetical protein
MASMRDERTSHSQLSDDYSMRAQIFYTTGINALEDPASHYFPMRDNADTESNQAALLVTTIATRVSCVYH